VQALRVGVLARRDAHRASEGAFELVRAHPGARAHGRKREAFVTSGGTLQVRVDGATNPRDGCDARIALPNAPRMATAAFAETLLLGSFGQRIERDLLTVWPSRWTRRAAIDAGRAHGVDESAVCAAVAGLHGSPVAIGAGTFSIRSGLSDGPQHISFTCLAHPTPAI
jgi:hypothetical protein